MDRPCLTAPDGKILTNGRTYGRKVYPSVTDEKQYWEIPISDYEKLVAEEHIDE